MHLFERRSVFYCGIVQLVSKLCLECYLFLFLLDRYCNFGFVYNSESSFKLIQNFWQEQRLKHWLELLHWRLMTLISLWQVEYFILEAFLLLFSFKFIFIKLTVIFFSRVLIFSFVLFSLPPLCFAFVFVQRGSWNLPGIFNDLS